MTLKPLSYNEFDIYRKTFELKGYFRYWCSHCKKDIEITKENHKEFPILHTPDGVIIVCSPQCMYEVDKQFRRL